MTVKFIVDNNDDHENWPDCEVIITKDIEQRFIIDNEPYQQLVLLSCGHWLCQTYGDKHKKKIIGSIMECRSCFYNK